MKTVTLSILVLGLAGGTWTWIAPKTEPKSAVVATAPDRLTDAKEQVGLRKMLTDQQDLALSDLVIGGAGLDGLRDFRARMTQRGQSCPIFGQARRTCADAPTTPGCWEIAYLAVDGKTDIAVALLPTAPLATADLQAPSDNLLIEEVIETADLPRVADSVATPPRSTPLDIPLAQATHRVTRPVVNARSGPGIDNSIVTKLHRGTDLYLLSQTDDWGRFLILSKDGDGNEVWAALRILEDLR